MDGHLIGFYVTEVDYLDQYGNPQPPALNTPDNHQDLSGWASFESEHATTDSDGAVTDTLDVADDNSIVGITMKFYDVTVWETDGGPDGY